MYIYIHIYNYVYIYVLYYMYYIICIILYVLYYIIICTYITYNYICTSRCCPFHVEMNEVPYFQTNPSFPSRLSGGNAGSTARQFPAGLVDAFHEKMKVRTWQYDAIWPWSQVHNSTTVAIMEVDWIKPSPMAPRPGSGPCGLFVRSLQEETEQEWHPLHQPGHDPDF